jgi:iron-sulfur cluster assembly protein
MITITEIAAKEINRIIEEQDEKARQKGEEPAKMYLRVGVKGGGCSGFSYTLDLTETVGEQDETFTQHGIEVACDPKSLLYLEGTTALYSRTPTPRAPAAAGRVSPRSGDPPLRGGSEVSRRIRPVRPCKREVRARDLPAASAGASIATRPWRKHRSHNDAA